MQIPPTCMWLAELSFVRNETSSALRRSMCPWAMRSPYRRPNRLGPALSRRAGMRSPDAARSALRERVAEAASARSPGSGGGSSLERLRVGALEPALAQPPNRLLAHAEGRPHRRTENRLERELEVPLSVRERVLVAQQA